MNQRSGFTILEVVLAMGILVIGMTVIISLLTFGAAMTRTASLRTAAASASEAVMADLAETLFPLDETGFVGEPNKIEARQLAGAPQVVYSATSMRKPDNHREYRVDVEMSWETSGQKRSKKFTTILLREVPFGERMRREFIEGSVSPPEAGVRNAEELTKK